MTKYDIADTEGRVQFEGEHLASASNREGDAIRWTEVHVWKTKGGKYVLQKIGKTVVYHLDIEDGCKHGVPTAIGDIPELDLDNLAPCPVCKPHDDILFFEDDDFKVRVETDRFTVHVSETAQGLISSAMLQDNDGTVYLIKTAREALTRAAAVDEAVRDALFVRKVD